MGENESDDFYELYEEYLDDDQISPNEEAFIKGFNDRESDGEPDNGLVIEMEEINLEWDEGSEGQQDSDEKSDDEDYF